jgi:PPIC-type PPIASE domain
MANFDEVDFLTIDGQTISLGRAFGYLQLFGRLQPFVQECLRYQVIYREIQTCKDLIITSAELSQTAIDFRLRTGLTDGADFDRWLQSQGIDYATFENQVLIGLKLKKMKEKVTAVEMESHFADRRAAFDEIELYYIIVAEEELVNQIKQEVTAGKTFEQIARDYPLSTEQKVIVKRETLRREKIRQEILAALAIAPMREVVGPIVMGQRWCIFQVEQMMPAVFNRPPAKVER